jgi:hypothetical protein
MKIKKQGILLRGLPEGFAMIKIGFILLCKKFVCRDKHFSFGKNRQSRYKCGSARLILRR